MIKNLIFDVGGVLIGYRWEEMLADYGLSEDLIQKVGGTIFSDPIWSTFDSGLISIEELKQHYHKSNPELMEEMDYFLDHAELMRVDLPEVWEMVAYLHKEGYHTYILSNYSEVLFRKHTDGASFLEEMDGGIVSYQVKTVKPDPAIYEALLTKYGLCAEESLFFDDRLENVEAAQKLGINGFHVESTELLLKELKSLRKH